jgi:hypothetical protein
LELILFIAKIAEDTGRSRACHRFPGGNMVAGAADGCDLVLPELADVSFAVNRDDNSRLLLTRKDPKLELEINGRPLVDSQVAIENSDVLAVGGYEIQVSLAFERSKQRAITGLLPVITGFLIAIIILAEVSVATWLPRQISKREFWAEELAREQTKDRMDHLRRRIRLWHNINKAGDDTRQTLQLLKQEADKMAFYLRRNQEKMSPQRLQAFKADVDRLHRILDHLQKKRLYPKRRKVDLRPAVKSILDHEESR